MDPSTFSFPKPKAKPPPTPQALVSKFWSKYHAKSPGKVTSIFPRSLYKSLLPNTGVSQSRARNAASSYEEARAECRARVRAVVAECERTNSKFSDPDFDIEIDYLYATDNCLHGLLRSWEQDDDDDNHHTKIPPWQVKMSLDTLQNSGVLGNDKLMINVNNLGRYITGIESFSNLPPPRPGSVHRLSWIFENPQFTVDGFSGTDIKQGATGDCWWLAALATIAHRKDLMNKICVERDEECGVYGFVFNRDGEWISTVIDDNLYLKDRDFGYESDIYDSTGKKARIHKKQKQTGSEALFFAKCEDANETWLPLLEKAFAKIHGDYNAISGGWAGNAVEDLTGGVTTVVAGNKVLRKERLWREMATSGTEEGEFVFGISPSVQSYDCKRNGIILHHAYSVLQATEVEDEEGKRVRLVKVRNPWGQRSEAGFGEWHGPWSDGSREWTPYMIQKLRHKFGDDGVFWMTYDDLLSNFKWIYRTRLFDQRWTVVQEWTSLRVSWLTGYLKKKFIVEVKEAGMVVIVLSQLDSRYFSDLKGQYDFTIQFLLKPVDSETPLCQVRPVHKWDKRSINCELSLEAGTYEVIPNISADRDPDRATVEQVVKATADTNPQKLRQVGLQYDLAHAKGGVLDEDEELQKRREAEKKKRRKQKKKAKQANHVVEDAMRRMEEALLHMRKEMTRGSAGDGETKDKDDPSNDNKKTDDKESNAEVKSSKPTPGTSPEASFKTVPESQAKETVTLPPKLQPESSSLGPTDKIEDNKKQEPQASTSKETSPNPLTPPSDTSADNEVPKPESKEVPVLNSDSNGDSSESESASSSDDDSDSDTESESESEDCDKSKKKKKPWNAVCVLGLKVYAQHANIKVRLEEQDATEASSDLITKEGKPVGPTS
ncbi:hypothetical protein B0T10DRAFT_83787 [Thelonectria olida]|uniref:Calpain catalytic domain-containing protein n=1 Tax=Thelonectria olida TaxID=1576542 RepID=A0A9P9AMZ0_9HYPO|nr:hypothetical protein B0T10DRAFT_83787 [Thelonectria olida]